eukprot:10265410-Lingulodinium_polyedra.AAC.1
MHISTRCGLNVSARRLRWGHPALKSPARAACEKARRTPAKQAARMLRGKGLSYRGASPQPLWTAATA